MTPPRALVVTVSTRLAAGEGEDRSGPTLVEGLTEMGFEVEGPVVVADGEPVEAVLQGALTAYFDLVVTTGGTGITPTDHTPEMTARVLEREIPGIAEALRAAGIAKGVPTAVLSRGVAGLSGRTLIVNLPGSTGGVRDSLEVLGAVLPHALEQIHGSDHPRID